MFKKIILLLALNLFARQTSANEISCEKIESPDRWGHGGPYKSCILKTTPIISRGLTIASSQDNSITGLNLWKNRDVSYLPVGVHEKFVNLLGYSAGYCSIKSISKANFANMRKLQVLYLGGNQLKQVDSSTFEDLISLQYFGLGKQSLELLKFYFTFFSFKQIKIKSRTSTVIFLLECII